MKKVKIIEVTECGFYNSFDEYNYDYKVTSNIDWEEVSEEEYREIVQGIQILNRKNINSSTRYAIISLPDQKHVIDLSLKAIKKQIQIQREEEEKHKKKQEEAKAKRAAQSQERKLKQFQKLQKELGLVNEDN